ncbi:NifB/NifX family molybdenum-iron cluster-binding protein [Desulfolutivibrio sulfoxidireducens]|uniref:NifB/NifX family molybdenum-iron cluster-binding protein n=1 Tax=Desulfolutivibrio sulfoxidireducens TaxID=2773299 RepID=UPI00159D6763|nr:NifB/NifX family molybdenum-iron cluster-binding protein [Desulfolutivibrio sulfoxidireducens]QLA15475.1 dinitrogenase iron-molybdenum cofactor biosynthesis protein [Desulfolutivibrio sulfoxidireducens]
MKIAITTEGKTLESRLDPRFGRAAGFMVHDLETGENAYAGNEQNLSLPQGAGIQSAQTVAGLGAGAVITGHVGPKAHAALQKGGIRIFLAQDLTVREAIEAYQAGTLAQADAPDKGGHW